MNEQSQLRKEDPKTIVRSPFNRQVDTKSEAFGELVESVRAHGIVEPLIVRPMPAAGANGYKFELIAGERRWRAAAVLKLPEVPIVVREASDTEVIELQTIENEQREDLSPIEQAEKYQQLLDQYAKEKPPVTGEKAMERLCAAVMKSKSSVYDALRLIKLPEPVKKAVNAGQLPVSHASIIAKLPAEVQPEALRAIAPGKRLSNKEESLIEDQTGQWIEDRNEETGLASFRETKEVVDSMLCLVGEAKKYEEKAATFRNKGGIALTWQEARSQQGELVAGEEYDGNYNAYLRDLVKGVKDLPPQIMRPHPHRSAEPQMVWRRKEVLAALTKAGVKRETFGHSGATTNYAKLERDRQARARSKKAILGKILEPLRAAAGKRNAKIPWPLFLAHTSSWSGSMRICRRMKWPASWKTAREVMAARAAKLPENRMAGVAVELLIESFITEHTGGWRPELLQLANFYGIDAKAIVKAEQKKVQASGTAKKKGGRK